MAHVVVKDSNACMGLDGVSARFKPRRYHLRLL